MSNTNLFKVSFCVIGNIESATAVTFSTSIKKALKQASSKAWDAFTRTPSTNYADCWVNIYNPRGKMIWSGFEGELSQAA
jgi:hypothetical protein